MSYKCYKCRCCDEYYPNETMHVTICSARYPGKPETREYIRKECWVRMYALMGVGLAHVVGSDRIKAMMMADDFEDDSE